MKKSIIALFFFAPVLCFGDTYDFRVYRYAGTGNFDEDSSMTVFYNYHNIDPSSVLSVLMSSSIGIACNPQRSANEDSQPVYRPTAPSTTGSTQNYTRPLVIHSPTGDIQYVSLIYHSSDARAYYNFVARLFQSGYTPVLTNNQHFVRSSSATFNNSYRYGNFSFSTFLLDLESTTNNLYRSILSDYLKSISQSLSNIHTSINNINVDLGQFQNDYSFVNASHFNITNVINKAVNDFDIPSRLGNSLKTEAINSSNYDDIQSILYFYRAAQWLPLAFSDSDLASPMRSDSRVKSGLANLGDSFGAGAAGHYTTPLTNEMKRMTSDWVKETKAALSNNTQKIKDDLAAWKNQLHGTQTSIDNSAANINNTLNNIAGGSSVVRVSISDSADFGVTLSGPVTIDSTQFNAFSEDLGKAGDYMERLFNEFKWWAWDSPDSWKKGFLDRDLSRLSSNVQEQVSLQHSISNLLADFAFNFTNNTEFAISNALAGFTFSSTNDYLLLSDYADYINTSGLSDLLGVLDDDSYSGLKDELISIGADDVSSGYGRWWRYYTGLSTIQANSVFKIANLLLDHEKLLTDLKRENTDVVDLSDSNVFSELLSKIPSQTHIDNKISELTNAIDQSGFARIRELIPDLTNCLSVASALYDHDFALPTDISWVLIPADSDLNIKERVVHISPSEHYRVFQVLHYGIAFSYCIVNLILFPKFLLLLVRLFDRVWNKAEHLIYNSTQS